MADFRASYIRQVGRELKLPAAAAGRVDATQVVRFEDGSYVVSMTTLKTERLCFLFKA